MLLFSLLICPPLWIKFNISFLLTYPLLWIEQSCSNFIFIHSFGSSFMLFVTIVHICGSSISALIYNCPLSWIEHYAFCCPLLWIKLYAFCYFCPLLWIEHYAFCYYYPLCGSSFVLLLLLSTLVERAFML